MLKLFSVVSCACLLLMGGAVVAAPNPNSVGYDLTLQMRAPVWSSQNGYIDNWKATELGGSLKIKNVFPTISVLKPLVFTVAGMHALGDWNTTFDAKNELQAGIEYGLSKNTTFFSYWDRHFTRDVDRVFVGLRYNTHGIF